MVHPCLSPLFTSNSGVTWPSIVTSAFIPSCKDLMMFTNTGRMPFAGPRKACRSWYCAPWPFLSTVSHKRLCQCILSPCGNHTVNQAPLPQLTAELSRCWIILAKTFTKTSNKLIPLQLSHDVKSPFFGIGTIIASLQSLGTASSLHTVWKRSRMLSLKQGPLLLTSSGKIPLFPPALCILKLPIASLISSSVGGSARSSLT